MKKGMIAGIFCAAALALVAGGCSKREEAAGKSSFSIGMTVKDLSNPTWGATCQTLDGLVKADGGVFTYVDCQGNPNNQIQQVENFIANNVDAIIIQVAEPNSLENVLAQARSNGIKVFCWDNDIENSDINWLISNYDAGRVIGTQAAAWINEKLGGTAEYAILNYDQEEILLERGNGIRDSIRELAPQAVKVADQSAINPREGISQTETILEAYPNLKVIACIGGGGAVGANNAVKAANKLTDDFGIFAADATAEEVEAIRNNEAIRMSVLFSGSPRANGYIIYEWVKKLLNNEPTDRKVMREMIPVTINNLEAAE
ncbi:MAG: sugar ABC transporter substrate-binding protein [Spirochaetaceae bacterium]|jgi:ribose transport system substrate-binding protein|nr:sugar ABC transporter substrate-binding protein [Spirochaetaceae bacterium]